MTNVAKNNKKELPNIPVEVKPEEKVQFDKFFEVAGMKTCFLDEHPGKYTLSKLRYAISSGNFKALMLVDVRAFVEKYKDGVAELLKNKQDISDIKSDNDGE